MMLSCNQLNDSTFPALKEQECKQACDQVQKWDPFSVSVDPSLVFKPKCNEKEIDPLCDSFLDQLKNLKIGQEFELAKDKVIQILNIDEEDSKSIQSDTPSASEGSDSSEETPLKSVTL